MDQRKILALSSSRAGESAYLETAQPLIKALLGTAAMRVAFIPFASVDNDYASYTNMVKEGLVSMALRLHTVQHTDAKETLQNADVIMVGGGNTFKLLHNLYEADLLDLIKEKVNAGIPYIGWSAGSNILGPTIGTTNDMPVIQPPSFKALHLLPFQINPHYTNALPAGHRGETRDQRLQEFVKMNSRLKVIALPEGAALMLQSGQLELKSETKAWLFAKDEDTVAKKALEPGSDLTKLL